MNRPDYIIKWNGAEVVTNFIFFSPEKINFKTCFNFDIPSQDVSNVLIGGGEATVYLTESELEESSYLEIGFTKLPTPTTVEQLQENHEAVKENLLFVNLD